MTIAPGASDDSCFSAHLSSPEGSQPSDTQCHLQPPPPGRPAASPSSSWSFCGYNENGFIKDVDANFIVWEIHGRDDYTYNLTMQKSGCLNEAQTWKKMIELNKNLSLDEVWGPENYKHCFSYGIGKPGDLSQPYEIINKSNRNHLVWPLQHAGMYVFRVKILDPNYSFCDLRALFAIQISGVIPSPNGYLVFSVLFLLMLLFCSILTFSYFHYMMIYNPDNRKQKDN
uniref:CATSPERD/E C-terminal domain-containing protein n=1 Tax=Myotis myotis TaxID=51298 RepID=A0A7J7RUV0_MYOMY|nr:hypothetical protein mMyoMyo1_010171 [Myotis myotis]